MSSDCPKGIADKLVDYANGVLPAAAAAEIARHLEQCETCRRQLDALQRSLDLACVIWEDSAAQLTNTASIRNANRPAQPTVWRSRMSTYGAVAAALAIAIGVLEYATSRHVHPSTQTGGAAPSIVTVEDIKFEIACEAVASQLLMAADLLAEQPGGIEYACENYRYIAAAYSNSLAAQQSLDRLQEICNERIEQ